MTEWTASERSSCLLFPSCRRKPWPPAQRTGRSEQRKLAPPDFAIYYSRYFAGSGGLTSYGVDFAERFHEAAGYIDHILKGAKSANLPMQAPTQFELVINLKAAKALAYRRQLLATAEEVIE